MNYAYNNFSGVMYQGRNQATLSATGFEKLAFGTYLQWKKAGYKVKKGEHGFCVINFAPTSEVKKGKEGKPKVVASTSVRAYHVFNVAQVEAVK